ncbi:MAG TPA: hypothetical protein VL737_01125 [Candidatus Pristimantibacillus sp.]|nr:hypothetical protein [Candidatus Pristimantibacillus sp.]
MDSHPAIARKRAAEAANEEEQAFDPTANLDEAAWPHILAAVKQHHNTLYSIVRTTRPHFEPGKVTLECGFAFHQKKLNEKGSKKTLADIIQQVTGQNIQIACILGETTDPNEAPKASPILPPAEEKVHTVAAPKPETEDVKNISNIFGGAELLES